MTKRTIMYDEIIFVPVHNTSTVFTLRDIEMEIFLRCIVCYCFDILFIYFFLCFNQMKSSCQLLRYIQIFIRRLSIYCPINIVYYKQTSRGMFSAENERSSQDRTSRDRIFYTQRHTVLKSQSRTTGGDFGPKIVGADFRLFIESVVSE